MTAAELSLIMKTHGWTQVYLAEELPVESTRIIRYWLSGKHPIREVIAHRIREIARKETAYD